MGAGTMKSLWKVSVRTSVEAEDAVAELVRRRFGQPTSTYRELATGRTTVTAYLPNKPDWSAKPRAELRRDLDRLRACGLEVGAGTAALSRVRSEDWAESWKRHFRPLVILNHLLVKPSWSRRQPGRGQALVVLDPGLSFGTGQHPTTAFCLEELVRNRQRGQAQSFLDVGTGSGILAIAAAKLGYAPVEALDTDADAVRIARANAGQNGVRDEISFQRRDLTRLPRRSAPMFSVIAANLISTLLLTERARLTNHLAPQGILVLAGILDAEFGPVQRAYERAGLRLVRSRKQGEWRSGCFRWRAR